MKNNKFLKFLSSDEDGVYYVGHASILVRIDNKFILYDPAGCSPDSFFYSWFYYPEQYLLDEIIEVLDYVVVSHCHKDHLDPKFLKKLNNLVFINYCPELEKFLFWSQQLIAESLGKKKMGFLPIISNAPKDHHSLLQLYLDGPKDKLFVIFSSERKSKEKVNMLGNLGMNTFLNKKYFVRRTL